MLTKKIEKGDSVYVRSWYSKGFVGEMTVISIGIKYFTVGGNDGLRDLKFNKKDSYPHSDNDCFSVWNSKEDWLLEVELNKEKKRFFDDLRYSNIELESIEKIKEARQFLGLGE